MSSAFLRNGKELAKEGRFGEALEPLEAAVREEPRSPAAWLALAACYFRLDRNDECRESVRKALKIDPDHAPTLRFLKRITGGDTIPATDPGRPKIVVEEPIPPGRKPAEPRAVQAETRSLEPEAKKAEPKGAGCGVVGPALVAGVLAVSGGAYLLS